MPENTRSSDDVQSFVQPDAPFPECPASGRNPDGTFARANRAGLRHGGYSLAVRRGLTPDARASLATKRGQLLADQGGPEGLGQVRVDLVERYCELDTVVRHLAGHLANAGMFTERGRTRAAFAAFLQVIDRWLRVAQLLGLDTRPRDLSLASMTLEQYVEHERQTERQAHDDGAGGPTGASVESEEGQGGGEEL